MNLGPFGDLLVDVRVLPITRPTLNDLNDLRNPEDISSPALFWMPTYAPTFTFFTSSRPCRSAAFLSASDAPGCRGLTVRSSNMLRGPRHAEAHPSTRSCERPCLPLLLPTPRPSMVKDAMHEQSHGRISKTPTPLATVTKTERAAWMPSQRACSITLLQAVHLFLVVP